MILSKIRGLFDVKKDIAFIVTHIKEVLLCLLAIGFITTVCTTIHFSRKYSKCNQELREYQERVATNTARFDNMQQQLDNYNKQLELYKTTVDGIATGLQRPISTIDDCIKQLTDIAKQVQVLEESCNNNE